MPYLVEIEKMFKAKQGLKSPVLSAKGLPPSAPEEGFSVVMRVGIVFEEAELSDRGWFVDTDALDDLLAQQCSFLAGKKWTELFDFRPTFEQVTRWVYNELQKDIRQLSYVELDNITLGVRTRYQT